MTETTKEKGVEQSNYTAQDFQDAYQQLCEKMGYQIVVNPVWVSTNHGSFETTLQVAIGKLPKKN